MDKREMKRRNFYTAPTFGLGDGEERLGTVVCLICERVLRYHPPAMAAHRRICQKPEQGPIDRGNLYEAGRRGDLSMDEHASLPDRGSAKEREAY